MKKITIILIKTILIILPIIVFLTDFCTSFWGVIYKLDIDQTNIVDIEDVLQKDNIKIDNINNVNKIEIKGAGLNDYYKLCFYYNDNTIKMFRLYLDQRPLYIEQYLLKHTFNYTKMFDISLVISLFTIIFSLYKYKKVKTN